MSKASHPPANDSAEGQNPKVETGPPSASRRAFLKNLGIGTGVLAVGVLLGSPTLLREGRLALNQVFLAGGAPSGPGPEDPFIWFRLDTDGRAHLFVPKVEMGQGIHTALAQIAADELEIPWEQVVVHQADTDVPFSGFTTLTFGSVSVTSLFQPVRVAAATLRGIVRIEAAAQMGLSPDAVIAEDGVVWAQSDSSRRLGYGEVVAARHDEWTLPESDVSLKAPADFRYIGRSMQRVDLSEKITGRAVYGFDARLPDMLYGAVARPPRFGATLAGASAGAAASQPGVVAVVIQDGFAGVVAQRRRQAYAALDHLELSWEGGARINQQELEASVSTEDGKGVLVQRSGNLSRGLQSGRKITAGYWVPLAAHAHLEPQAALADVRPDGVDLWVSTQAPSSVQSRIASLLDRKAEGVRVIPTYLGGGFGRKMGYDSGTEAARLSAAVGQPVHVGWTRTEEMRHGYLRPPARSTLQATLDDDGRILALEQRIASGDILFGQGNFPAESIVARVVGADPGALTPIFYNIPNLQLLFHKVQIPVPTGSWRGLGTLANVFALESFLDEIAAAADRDPLALRLELLPQDEQGRRMRRVLERATKAAEWTRPREQGRGLGLALSDYGGTVVALVAEASLLDGSPQVHSIWCTVDPGLVVNPDGAEAQAQGTIIMALSSVLHEQLTVEEGMIVAANFDRYPLISQRSVPDIHVDLVSSSDRPIGGMGEPVIGVVPAAVANAIFAASGRRLRSLPLRA